MNLPKRAQRKRIKGWTMPPNSKYCGRPTKFGNPYSVSPTSRLDEYSRISAVEFYKVYLERNPELVEAIKTELKNYDYLLCWCPLDQNCHVDVIIELLEKG